MRRMARSFRFALEGAWHALCHERNLRFFILGECIVLLVATQCPLERWEWVTLVASGFAFVAIELFNTALERLTDAVDHLSGGQRNEALHQSMKATKDVSAAAALVAFLMAIIVIVTVLGPHLFGLTGAL